MPSEMAAPKKDIDMRRTKLTAAEAAMLAGEMNKPSWQSRNEGIHERVSFEDSIWGFDLAGGSFYKTPLRVTAVKADSRAEKAGIRPGDKLLRINDIDTSTLTIQEAHEIIIESGVYLRIAVTAPDDEEDSYFCWEDPLEQGYDSEEERRREKEKAKKREVHAKVSSYWSLQWPWVSKRRVIYRESNCFMVPSKYEDRHRDKFPIPTFGPKVQDDIVLFSGKNKTNTPQGASETEAASNPVPNGNKVEDAAKDSAQNEQNSQPKTKAVDDKVAPNTEDFTNVNGQDAKHADLETKSKTETVEENTENVLSHTEDMASVIDNPSENNEPEAMTNGISEENNAPEAISNGFHENEQMDTDAVEVNKETLEVAPAENSSTENPDVEIQSDLSSADDEILNEVLEKLVTPNGEMEDKTFEDILNESDANTNDEAVDETQR